QMADAVRRGGLQPTDDPVAADALVWCSPDPAGLAEVLGSSIRLRWVQLPYAGVERFLEAMTPERIFTCAKGIYGPSVAEMTLGLLITAFRRIDCYAKASSWSPLPQRPLAGAHVAILGGGGIGRALASMLQPLESRVTIVRRERRLVNGASVATFEQLAPVVTRADAVVLALPLTAETTGLVDMGFLRSMKPTAWLVNVARGRIVNTDDLVRALDEGLIAGACLDVTDPEPLPDGHRLWGLSNCIITPHVANTPEVGDAPLLAQVEENCRRFAAGVPLDGVVDQMAGY
ncbi:MAG: NAD(P)-dependent oxidoreductase, partial [Acidimicrobiales bacterium]